MNDEQLRTLAQMRAFLEGTTVLEFSVAAEERYGFIGRTVRRFGYARLKRTEKTAVLRFLEHVSGFSRQQLTRLVKRGCKRSPADQTVKFFMQSEKSGDENQSALGRLSSISLGSRIRRGEGGFAAAPGRYDVFVAILVRAGRPGLTSGGAPGTPVRADTV